MLVHLPREEGFGTVPRVKNGLPLAGYGAITMKNALCQPDDFLTRAAAPLIDLGIAAKNCPPMLHSKFETGIPVYFADPHSPWQRGTNEKHQWAAAPVFPEGHRLVTLVGE